MISTSLTLVFDRKGQASRTKPASVELRVYADGKQKYISTGIKLLPKEWSKGMVNSCRKDYQELNEQLFLIVKKTSELVAKMLAEGTLNLNALPDMLKDELTQTGTFISYAKELAEIRYKNMAKGTIKRYKVFFDFLESWKGIVYFTDLNEKNIQKMDDELASRGLKVQSRWNYHKVMKLFISRAMNDGKVKKNPYSHLDIKRGNESGLTHYLTPKEFHEFEKCVIPSESLRKVRDLFVFQTYTMMAYSDMAEFDIEKCVKVKGQTIYKAKRIKTGQEFTIVLLAPARAILNRYKNKLPMISNVKYNLYLKAAVMYAKINKPVTTHWARHTGATLLLNEGQVPMHIVQHILGHATIRETERTYAKVLDNSIVETMADFQKKLV